MRFQSVQLMKINVQVVLAAVLLSGTLTARAAEPDASITRWLGTEITVESSSVNDLMPVGGKLSFIFDPEDNTVRICTRHSNTQRGPWRMDMAPGCNVALLLTRGQRYCTIEDVKAGNAEVLSACHRLRSRDVALRPSKVRGHIELHDVIVFPVDNGQPGDLSIAILVDSPSRVTDGGVIIGGGRLH